MIGDRWPGPQNAPARAWGLAASAAELTVLRAEYPMARLLLVPGRDGPLYAASLQRLGGSGWVLVTGSDRELRAELAGQLALEARLISAALASHTVTVAIAWRGRRVFEAIRRPEVAGGLYAARSADAGELVREVRAADP